MIHLLLCLALLAYPSPEPPQLRLVVMGDSITVGLGASTPDKAWAAIVAQQTGRQLVNLAIGGSRVAEQLIPQVQYGDLIIWLVGYNDVRAGTDLASHRATVASGVAQLRSQGARVVLASGLRMTEAGYAAYGPMWNKGSATATATFVDGVLGMAEFIDLLGVVPSPTADLIHPDDAGHAAIAQAMLDQLAPPLEATWANDVLEVAANAPGCLYLIGNGRPSQWIGCDQPHYTLWPSGDQQYVPMNRTLVLRDELNQREVARLVVPPRVVVWMPLAAMP